MSLVLKIVLLAIGAYFLGNITFARIIARAYGDNITKRGSGNPGTSNMLRFHGAVRGFLVLLLDLLKGVVCVLVAYFVCGGKNGGWQCNLAMYITGFFCILGHIFPVIFKFKGGKGLATAAGVVAVLNPIAFAVIFVFHWVSVYFFKVASLIGFISCFLFVTVETILLSIRGYYFSIIVLFLMLGLILFAHRANIKRLIARTEGTLDLKESFAKSKQLSEEKKAKKKQNK